VTARLAVTLAFASLAAVGVVESAQAKSCVRIAAPATVLTGKPMSVTVTTLMPSGWVDGRPVGLRPEPSTVALRLVLEGPGGQYREVKLRRLTPRASKARATIRMAARGVWKLSVLGWAYAPQACAPPRHVRVL
jgi:hypothetical protein